MNYLFEKFKEFDAQNAIIFDDKVYSYIELLNQIFLYKKVLNEKINANSVVAILGDYSFENIALFFALITRFFLLY